MLPLGHAALAYLLYAPFEVTNRQPVPATWALLPLAVGSQFPDLVDKPLAYYGILTYGRSLAHSLLALTVSCGFVWWLAHRSAGAWPGVDWREQLRAVTPAAFTVGYASHLVGDAARALLAGVYVDARFVFWPLSAYPESPADDIHPWNRFLQIYHDMETHPDLELILLAGLVFLGIRAAAVLQSRRPPPGSPGP